MKSRSKPGNKRDLHQAYPQTTEEAADELDVTVGRMHDLYAKGAPHERPRKPGQHARTSAAAIIAWAKEAGVDIHAGPGRPRLHDDSPDLEAARLRKENALAAKYELQVSRERGELVPIDEVRRQGVRLLTTVKNRMQSFPPAWAVNTEGRNAAERQQIAQEDIGRLLDALANDIRRLGDGGYSAAAA